MKSAQGVNSGELVLGLDIGAASVGWALIQLQGGMPKVLRATGVRAFPAGVEGGDASAITAGRDVSSAAKRREARSRRRLLARRRHRLTKLALLLQHAGLLPQSDVASGDALVQYFAALDRELFPADARHDTPHLLPYRLRARALDEKLTPYEIGRALYHLAHRRGFLSNRRVKPKAAGVKETDEEKEEGKVKGAISELAQRMRDSGARTLGDYLSRLNPEEERVRNRYLSRKMLQDEFDRIWAAQFPHFPDVLADDLKQKVHRAIFFQRPLKTQRHLIGDCDLEKGRKRAPLALLSAERFRLLQKANDLRVRPPDSEERDLIPTERAALVNALEQRGDLTFEAVRKELNLPKGVTFNFQTDGEKGLIGNRTGRKLAEVFGNEQWTAFAPTERDRVVEDLLSIHNHEALKRRATRAWGLNETAADRFASIALEHGYCNLSRQALARVLAPMEQGVPYATARKQIYGETPPLTAVAALPRLEAAPFTVRNPAVERALTEVRKVVNAVVREHGLPGRVRIELARDLKKPRKERKAISERNAANRKAREAAAKEIEDLVGPDPRRSDREKVLLWKECREHCPYTGKPISRDALFGEHPQFDVEHIIPFPRCLDNSFMNKTLCEVTENRSGKGNRTPWEAYGHDPERWGEIIARVRGFQGQAARAKFSRFQTREVASLEDFTTQQLNDTRYASRLAVEYLGLLYGAGRDGVDPQTHRKCVEASRGAVTYDLRSVWGLNGILGGGEKTRDDHRQHAIDAVVVALTEPTAIKRLSDAAERAPAERRRLFADMVPPWPDFIDHVRAAIDSMVVSHRVSRKVAAALHEETIYSKPHFDDDGKQWVHVRKPLDQNFSARDVANIVDPAVRQAVHKKLEEVGEKALKDVENHPALAAKDGRQIPIHSVRLRVPVTTEPIGTGPSGRHVKLGSNHHVEIIETTDRKGQPKWEGIVVSTLEAMQRLKARQPVIQRDHGPGKPFLFSLAGGETIELDAEQDERKLYTVRTISVDSGGRVGFVSINDARRKEDIAKAHAWYRETINGLRKRGCRKVVVTPLGEVRRASD
jgi:CRISPR-associated endonuclease Csn1